MTPRGAAIQPDPDASYDRAAAAPPATDTEIAVLSEQLGRPARGDNAVVHRCAFGLPTVVRVGPRLGDGTPFPTVFWLSCPVLSSAIGTLEGDRGMEEVNQRLEDDPDLAAEYAAAARRYVAFRDRLGGPLPGDPAAGGMPGYVKCLHVHVAHTLATGDNPVGAWALEALGDVPCPHPCAGEDRGRDEEPGGG